VKKMCLDDLNWRVKNCTIQLTNSDKTFLEFVFKLHQCFYHGLW